jgi:general secretion pathway protein D
MVSAIGVVVCLCLSGGAVFAAPPAGASAGGPADSAVASCRKLPAGKRIVRLSLKPETELGDLLAWISSITCKQFILPGTIPVGKKVTIISPQLITPGEAYRLFLSALDTVGLTVYPSGKFLRVIETGKAKSSPIPVYIDGQAGSDMAGDQEGLSDPDRDGVTQPPPGTRRTAPPSP